MAVVARLGAWVTAGALVLTGLPVAAWEARNEARVLFLGNSLIYHLTDSDTTAVPHWLALLARHGDKKFAADGRFGFPRNLAEGVPPQTEWQFGTVARIGPLWSEARARLYDSFIMNTENFVQGNAPQDPYLGDNPGGQSPLGATLEVLDWIDAGAAPDSRFLIYEGWADLNAVAKYFPPEDAAMTAYHDYARGDYHAWYLAFIDALRAARPEREIALIPVGLLMSDVLTMPALSDLPVETFFSDMSPHGTATTYLVAAMITYAALFGERPPAGVPLPDVIDPTFARNYEAVADLIWARLKDANAG